VPPLSGGDTVQAKQDVGGGFTPWSPEVEVEQVALPPAAAPHLPEQVGVCSQCVNVWEMVPGCEVELLADSDVVGRGTADRGGGACVGVDLRKLKGEAFGLLRAHMFVCGQVGPESATPDRFRAAAVSLEAARDRRGQEACPEQPVDPGRQRHRRRGPLPFGADSGSDLRA
jgi:hypothetical protein